MRLFLFWASANDNASIGYLAACRDLRSFDEEDCFGSCWHAVFIALSEAPKFIGKGCSPELFIRTLDEVFALLQLSGIGINDRICKVVAVDRYAHC
jgi:hypothetical protein